MRNLGHKRKRNSEQSRKRWCVYILKCSNNTLYTGITNNIERRIKEHNSKRGGHYTRTFGPVELVWEENYLNRSSALKREHQIKRWTRRKKKALVERNYEELKQDAHCITTRPKP